LLSGHINLALAHHSISASLQSLHCESFSKQSMLKYEVGVKLSGTMVKIKLGECPERYTLYKDGNKFGKRPPHVAYM